MLFVTGITGHTGRFFLKRLIKEKYEGEIRCVVRENSNTDLIDSSGLNIEKVYGDIDDIEFLKKNLQDVDTIIHIVNITYSPKIVEAAIHSGVKWVILVHTTGRYSKYKSASARYIQIEEDILKLKDKISITILRPTMIYGSSNDRNMYKLVDFMYNHKFFPMFGDGKNLMQPVHARDLGDAYYSVFMKPEVTMNKCYNLSGRKALTYLEIIKTISKLLNRNNVIVKIPLSISIFAAKVYNKLFKNALISVEQVLRMQEDKAFGYEEAKEDFGYSPVNFQDGIVDEINEYLAGVK